MNSVIRKLNNEEIRLYVEIAVNAYPGTMQNTPDFKERIYNNLIEVQENEESIDLFGLFREEKLIGGMRIHYYTMNLFSKPIEVGGVGFVAVDLMHKKEKVAKEMIQFFIEYFKERGTSLVMLYPFRPDFYKKMGFGYGIKMNQYKVSPLSFPNVATKDGILVLDESHKELIRECYDRYASSTHGMINKTNHELKTLFKNPDFKLVGYMNEGKLEGYIIFRFKKVSEGNFLNNNIMIHEYIYENPLAFAKLNGFIHSQADQIQRVIINSPDNSLQFLFNDPRNGSSEIIPSVYHETNQSGVGLMYRISDINKFFSQLHVESQVSSTFKLVINDSFMAKEPITTIVSLENGEWTTSNDIPYDFEINLDISDLSSLLMGAVDVDRLYQYGLLKIDNHEYLKTLQDIFYKMKEPICLTAF